MKIDNNKVVTMQLDQNSGSGFMSKNVYVNGYFAADIKLPNNYMTCGVNVNLYVSNGDKYPGCHDEVDIEFLGTRREGEYILQTNVYVNGSGDGFFDHNRLVIGREEPTTRYNCRFYVDDIPIRRYPNINNPATYPQRKMWVYGTIWDASDWATEGGKCRMNPSYGPYIAQYKNLLAGEADSRVKLNQTQETAMKWVHTNYLVYDYCQSSSPPPNLSLTPECAAAAAAP
ncbi:hypothetical protein DM860_010369 [Cuscuta australis]|uniref:Xyloglucan endotransglucosylase/hydrolase n=1 Tax=Cuscuta australis TaxID=267555 RepID=A0A328E5D6_9ASTE|nr:hypothetical protein DM860_010369 [Cuscuta australis]